MNTDTDLEGLTIVDLVDLEPSDDEIVDDAVEDDTDESDDFEDDFSYSAIDDRWNDNGVPSWSAWA